MGSGVVVVVGKMTATTTMRILPRDLIRAAVGRGRKESDLLGHGHTIRSVFRARGQIMNYLSCWREFVGIT